MLIISSTTEREKIMTIKYASKFGKNLQNTLDAIASAQEFNAGNLYAERMPIPGFVGNLGYLPQEWRDQLRKDAKNRSLYIVYSYKTPIAWLKTYDNGRKVFVIPDVRYSPTTSNHQGVVRRAVGEYEETLTP